MAAAFFFNCDVGRAESPVSPRADALDFLGDAAKYAVALAVVGLSLKWRAVAAPLKGGVMGLFGLWVAGSTIYNAVVGIVPKGELMGTSACSRSPPISASPGCCTRIGRATAGRIGLAVHANRRVKWSKPS